VLHDKKLDKRFQGLLKKVKASGLPEHIHVVRNWYGEFSDRERD